MMDRCSKLLWLFALQGALLLAAYCIYRKVAISSAAQTFLFNESENDGQFNFGESEELRSVLADPRLKSPAVLLLNQFALNITINFLCNVAAYEGVHQRLLLFTFDDPSHRAFGHSFPKLHVIRWRVPELESRFSFGEGRYQLFQYFRAKLAAHLSRNTESFWMIQADTIWRENLFRAVDLQSPPYASAQLVLDSEGSTGLLASMVAGGYFYVRSSPSTSAYFEGVAQFLLQHFATDNNVMSRQCLLHSHGVQCAFFPYSLISNWRYSPPDAHSPGPILFQYDGGDSSASKLNQMSSSGFLFYDPSALAPFLDGGGDKQSMDDAPQVECHPPADGTLQFPSGGGSATKGSAWIRLLHGTVEWICECMLTVRDFFLAELFPRYAYYLVV